MERFFAAYERPLHSLRMLRKASSDLLKQKYIGTQHHKRTIT
jgi:hypothetical protein